MIYNMNKKFIIKQTEEYVKKILEKESSGHDWWHIYRVWKNAVQIGKKENADLFIVQLAALLHDLEDWKFKTEEDSPKLAREWLENLKVDKNIIFHVCDIIKNMSFKGSGVKSQIKTKEGMVVQDADRLDALGAIGIARTFTTGALRGRVLYNPKIKIGKRVKDFRKKDSYSSIHHFYDKILLVKGLINTKTAKKIAEGRHRFVEQFLDKFFKEWEGKN